MRYLEIMLLFLIGVLIVFVFSYFVAHDIYDKTPSESLKISTGIAREIFRETIRKCN